MKTTLSTFAWLLIRNFRLGGLLLQTHPKSYLRKKGWFPSFSKKRSIDLDNQPLPWWSYGFIDFVSERLNSSMSILEFGSGSSTIWLAQRAKHVVSIENDIAWARLVKSFIPENAIVIEKKYPEYFEKKDLPNGHSLFDILIIDPLAHRINCAKAGIPFLKENGVVIWDNTDGPDWPEIKKLMEQYGFKEISFSGIAPQEIAEDRTTVFYKTGNIFNI